MMEFQEGESVDAADNFTHDNEQDTSMPVSVSVVVNDPECGAQMSNVGIFIMYYCDHCGLASRSLPDITNHLATSKPHSLSPGLSVKEHIDTLITLLNSQINVTYTSSPPELKTESLNVSDILAVQESTDLNDGGLQENKENHQALNPTVFNVIEDMDTDMIDADDINYDSSLKLKANAKKVLKIKKELSPTIPVLSNVEEKDMFVTDYMHFVKDKVDLLLFSKDRSEEVDKTDEYVLKEVVKYDKLKLKDKTLTHDFVWILPVEKGKRPGFSCHLCPRIEFTSQAEFDIHKQCHSNDYPGYRFHCCLCRKPSTTLLTETKEWIEMKLHLTNVHNFQFKTKCTHCDEEFDLAVDLRAHRNKVHRMYCKYKLQGCKFCTLSSTDLQLHHDCHSDEENMQQFQCRHCDFSQSKVLKKNSWPLIREHYARKHTSLLDQNNLCSGCHSNFLDADTFLDHYVICAKVNLVRHRCILCPKTNYIALPALEEHIVQHIYSDQKYIQAKIRKILDLKKRNVSMLNIYSIFCGFAIIKKEDGQSTTQILEDSFNTEGENGFSLKLGDDDMSTMENENLVEIMEETLKDYNAEAYSDGSFRCNMCYKRPKDKVKLLQHMARCHPQGHDVTTCEACGKTFRTKSLCRNHYNYIHLGKTRKYRKYDASKKSNKLYCCDMCTYTTPHSTRLRNHVLSVHMGVMPYKCDVCNYGTNEQSDLRRHKNKHLGVKKYVCEHCDYRAAQYWLLASHCSRQHLIKLPQRRPKLDLMGTVGSLRRNKNSREGKAIIRKSLKRASSTGISKIASSTDMDVVVKAEKNENFIIEEDTTGTEVRNGDQSKVVEYQVVLDNNEVVYVTDHTKC